MRTFAVMVIGVALALVGCSSSGSDAKSAAKGATAAASPGSVRPKGSAGCGSNSVASGHAKETLDSGGVTRTYWRDVPPEHNGPRPVPLVLDLHGYSEGADVHLQMSGLARYGTQHGFATLTPQGLGAVPRWDTTLGSADLKFVGALLDTAEKDLCIDVNREYATGLSNGAFLTSAIACEYSDRIAAVAPVAGARNLPGCKPTRPVPVVAFHGTADGYVSYTGGLGEKALDLPAPDGSGKTLRETATGDQLKQAASESQSIPEIMTAWAKRNGCGKGDTEKPIAADVTKLSWNCPRAAAVELYRVTGGGHAWPGSSFSAAVESFVGHTTMSIDADEIMWRFFVAHPLRPAA
ncbi:MAG: alpha/beta hydrolase family esterase [Acidimicrobiia bacterium]